MNKKKFFLVIDCETAGEITSPLVYDFGAKVIDLRGNTYEKGSWVVWDIYAKERELMKTAYYADKLEQYEKDLKAGTRKMMRFFNIRRIILNWLETYEVEAVCAYNTSFDIRALNNTRKHTTNGKYYYFFPKGTKFIDIWNCAASSIFQTASYYKMAYENDWYSEKGNVRTNAEVAYCFITGQTDFIESHTALEDVEIEAEIFLYCWKRTKPPDREIIGNPWRKPQKEWYFTEARKDEVI